jgi:ABC-type xylose transport system substrate-binding protein
MLEDWLDSTEPDGGFQEIAMPEEMYQSKEKLKEAGIELVEELVEGNLSKDMVEKQLNKEPVELESAAKWPVSVTEDESNMGYQDDLPLEKHEDLQPSRLHKDK